MSNERLSTPEASKALGIPVHVISYWLGQIPYPAEQDENGQWRLTPEALSVLQTVKELKEQNHSMETIRRMVRELAENPPPAPLRRPAGGDTYAGAPAGRPANLAAAAVDAFDLDSAHLPRIASSSGPSVAPGRAVDPAPPARGTVSSTAGSGFSPAAPVAAAKGERPTTPVVPSRAGTPQPAPSVPAGDAGAIAAYVARAVADAVRQETVLSNRYAHAAHQIGKLEAENEHLRQMLNTAQKRHQREVENLRARLEDGEEPPEGRRKTPLWAWLTMLALL